MVRTVHCRIVSMFRIAVAVLVLTVLSPVRAIAADLDFTADYDTQYAISPAGKTIVTQNVTLTNKQSTLYPKQYAVTLGTTSIGNVIAYDSKGVITPKIIQKDGITDIVLSFNAQVVGVGKQLPFTLRYENNDIARKLGSVWEVHLPGIENDPTLGEYNVSLQVPAAFGGNAYMTPPPATKKGWNKAQMLKGGVSAAYGLEQEFDVELVYNLDNDKLTPALYEVAIPPDTAFQRVSILGVEPKPTSMRRDEDGNWIATFELKGGQKTDVRATLAIKTTVTPRADFTSEPFDMTEYVKPRQYWETENPKIVELAKAYKTPRAIYDYVVGTLTYDYARVEQGPVRKGAVEGLADAQHAVCTEFADLFIAIARAAGIPAREVVGYAYTTDTKLRPLSLVAEVLHAWPEYYDRERSMWIPVDPTWGNTTKGINYFDKLDFNHIAFVIHGKSSELPYPAGSYKSGTTPRKNVAVRFADSKSKTPDKALKTTFDIPELVTAGYPLKGSVTVENASGGSIEQATIVVQGDPFPFTVSRTEKNIPPYGKVTIPVVIPIDSWFLRGQARIVATVNGEATSYYFRIRPMYWLLIPLASIISGILVLLWLTFRKK